MLSHYLWWSVHFSNVLLAYSGLSLAELAHLIENTQKEIFRPSPLSRKDFRHNYPIQRADVVAQVQVVWSQIKEIAVSADLMINEATTDDVLVRFETEPLDGYDLFILETMKKENINNIITDDGDYCTVPGITVFTANRNMINAARAQGNLLTR
jgi:predicted nucleic acid-binding protein